MNLRRLFAAVALGLLAGLSGCDTDNLPSHTGLPATDPANVTLLKHPPSRPYTELGTVRDMEVYYSPESKASNMDVGDDVDVRVVIRQRAARLGADAVIINDGGVVGPLDPSSPVPHIWIKGTAIHYISAALTSGTKSPSPSPP